jgi:hypothetical protein
MGNAEEKPGLVQHKLRPEVKRWLEQYAREQERSQKWVLNKIVEDAFAKLARSATSQAST